MISNNNNVETSRLSQWAKRTEPRLTVNQNYIFLVASIGGLDPVYPAFLIVLLMIIPGLVFHNTIRFAFHQLINSNREQLDAIAVEPDCFTLWYVVTKPWDAFKISLLGTLVNISIAVLVCLGPYYLSPFSASPLTYFNLAMALLFDIAMLYLGDYMTYKYLDSELAKSTSKVDIATKNNVNHKSINSKPKQIISNGIVYLEGSEEFKSLVNQLPNEIQYEKNSNNSEPSISGFIRADSISADDLLVDIIEETVVNKKDDIDILY